MDVDSHLKSSPNQQRLAITYRRIEELKPDPANPRRHSNKQIRQIANSIKSLGFNAPIAVDRDDKVVSGHGRLLACRLLRWTEVPTLLLDRLSPAQARAFMLADNRLAELADWDDRLLVQHLKELSLLVLDFNIEDTGFEIGEIDLRIASVEDPLPGADDPADFLPELPTGQPITKIGDLWVLGRHRLLCGSALDAAVFTTLMGEERAATVFTDPPYNVPIDGHATGLGAIRHGPFPMACGEMGAAEFTAFLAEAFGNLATFSVDGSIHFVCMDWRHLEELLAAGRKAYSAILNLCIWTKANSGMGSFYRSQHELVFVFKHGRCGHRNNVQLGRFGRNRSNVWTYPGANSFARHGEEGNLLALHPTVKPVAMVADAILDCTARGDIVLDAFVGSGTTIVAAERTGRLCRAIELDPGHTDTAVRRWQSLTGDEARHAANGRSFDDLAAEAEVAHAVR